MKGTSRMRPDAATAGFGAAATKGAEYAHGLEIRGRTREALW